MVRKFTRKSVKDIVFFLKSIGVNVHQQNTLSQKFYRFSSVSPQISAFIHMSLFVFVNRNHIREMVIVAAYLGSSITLLSSVYLFVKNENNILKLLQMIDQNVYVYPDEKPSSAETSGLLNEDNFHKVLILIIGYECFGFSLSLLSPLLAFLITGVYETSMYPGWYPLYEKPSLVMITSFLQLAGCLAAFWIYFVIQVFITSITIEFLRQYQRLGATLLNIHQKTNDAVMKKMDRDSWYKCAMSNFEDEFRRRYDSVYCENVIHCIKHHQQLQKLYHLFEPWFSAFYSMELVMSAATLALIFNNLLSANNPSTFLTIIGSTFNVLANIFSRCVIGEIFIQMNSKVNDVIFYQMNWWEMPIKTRNLLYLFHQMTKHNNYNLRGCYIYTASYYTFAQLLRISYSYFNIIRSLL